MASRLGLTSSGYYKNETGENSLSIVTLHRLWEHFGISLDWLFFDEEPKYRKDRKVREKELEQAAAELKRQLEAERSKKKGVQGTAGDFEVKPEMWELLEAMARVPMLYHNMMYHFQKFKVENKELFGSPPPPDQS
jgi:transcriptional regulator with XRE-family HTH domain